MHSYCMNVSIRLSVARLFFCICVYTCVYVSAMYNMTSCVYKHVASSPGHSHFFNVTRRREGEPGTRNHVRDV